MRSDWVAACAIGLQLGLRSWSIHLRNVDGSSREPGFTTLGLVVPSDGICTPSRQTACIATL